MLARYLSGPSIRLSQIQKSVVFYPPCLASVDTLPEKSEDGSCLLLGGSAPWWAAPRTALTFAFSGPGCKAEFRERQVHASPLQTWEQEPPALATGHGAVAAQKLRRNHVLTEAF